MELEKGGKLPFKAIFQQLGKYLCTPIMTHSTGARKLLDEKPSRLGSWVSTPLTAFIQPTVFFYLWIVD